VRRAACVYQWLWPHPAVRLPEAESRMETGEIKKGLY
jgi:hypothetical protein